MTVPLLLFKVTLLFSVALGLLPALRRASAALRHLLCALALNGALLLPFTLFWRRGAVPIALPVVFRASASAATPFAGSSSLTRPLLLFWAAGALLMMLRLAVGHWRLSQCRRSARRTEDLVPVYLADVSSPLLCGIFRSVILLPRDSQGWPATQRAAAIRHELAHRQRHDLLTSLLSHLACAFYWFHPLAWLLAWHLREEQEAACDDAVLSAGFEPATYAEALVATARQLTSTSLIGCHMLTRQTLKSRIARLLDPSLPRTSSTATLHRAALAGVAILAGIGLVYAEPQAQPKDEKVYKMGPDVSAPKVLLKVEPKYTDEARDAKIEGRVLLRIVVGTDGAAHDINIVSTPDAGLGIKAVEAVQRWKFQPGSKEGEPVPVQAQIEIQFKLL